MCRKLIFVVCVLALASTSYGLVVGDWEGSMDGWILNQDGAGIVLSYSSTGVTLDSNSLKLYDASAGWYNPAIQLKLEEVDLLDWFWNETVGGNPIDTFKLDVTRLSAENIRDQGWWDTHHDVMYCTSITFQDPETLEEEYYGGGTEVRSGFWWPTPQIPHDPEGTGDDAMEVSFDLTTARAQVAVYAEMGYTTITSTAIQLFLCNGGYNQATYYFDNAQLLPEPATMALLSLGGLALIRRKR
jgi:hypothetical protein